MKNALLIALVFFTTNFAHARVLDHNTEVSFVESAVNDIAAGAGFYVVPTSVQLRQVGFFSAVSGLWNVTLGLVMGQDRGVVYLAEFQITNGQVTLRGQTYLFTTSANENGCIVRNSSSRYFNQSRPACASLSNGLLATQQTREITFNDLIGQ